MSRTKRKVPLRRPFRKPKTKNSRVAEYFANQVLQENGFQSSNRQKSRANLHGSIPNNWDDLTISALFENFSGS